MKKFRILASILFVFAILSAFAMVSSADTPNYVVKVTSDKSNGVIKVGDQVKLSITVTDINTQVVSGGITSAEFCLSYNTDMFEFVSAAGGNGTSGSDSYKGATFMADLYSEEDGIVKLLMLPAFSSNEALVTDDNIICFTVVLKAKEQATVLGSDVKIVDDQEYDSLAVCSSVLGDGSSFDGNYQKVTLKLLQKLSTPANPALSDTGVASWDAVPNATSYKVQLYKDGEALGSEVSVNGASHSFSSVLEKELGGVYSFKVTAVSTDPAYGNSDTATSADLKHRGELITPALTVSADKLTGKVKFMITDTNPDDTVSVYIVTVYKKDGTFVTEKSSAALSGTIDGLTVGTEYDFTVQAMALPSESDDSAGNDDSKESAKSSLKVDGITGISVTKKPTLEYVEGDALDLSKMEVTVTYAVANKEVVKKDKFSTYGIKVSPAHGADLTVSMNGKKITVTCGSLTAAESLVLKVEAGLCPHENTEREHKDPTCSADGYDALVCSLCGIHVETTVIPALEHTFGDWTWVSIPTTNMDGVRKHTCSKCGEAETDAVTYAEYLAMISQSGSGSGSDSQPDASTTPVETTPEETEPKRRNDALGGLGDIGKLFLYALIAILFIIVLFVVLAVWLESRRNRRRKSRARTSRERNVQQRNAQTRSTYSRAPQQSRNNQHMRNGNGQRKR